MYRGWAAALIIIIYHGRQKVKVAAAADFVRAIKYDINIMLNYSVTRCSASPRTSRASGESRSA